MSLRNRSNQKNIIEEQKKLVDDIRIASEQSNGHVLSKVEQRNIILIGRTRTGKSTIKSLLLDPTRIPEDLTLFSRTETSTLDSYYVADKNFVLNIMDTPGLEERGNDELGARDNARIVNNIGVSINHEFTKLHIICFCISVTSGINNQDIQIIRQFMDIFGESVSKNSCLIITHCESKNQDSRNKLNRELTQDTYFKNILGYFQLGILFSGALNPDDYNSANETLMDQFFTIQTDRTKLIQLFTSNIDPVSLDLMQISELKRARDDTKLKETKLHQIQDDLDTQISKHIRTDDDLQTATAELEKIKSDVDKYEARITELQAQCKVHIERNEELQQALSTQQKYVQQYQTTLEAEQQAYNRVVEQLGHEQHSFSLTKRNLKTAHDVLKRIETVHQTENVHLREIYTKVWDQLANEQKKSTEGNPLDQKTQAERSKGQTSTKDKKSGPLALLNSITSKKTHENS